MSANNTRVALLATLGIETILIAIVVVAGAIALIAGKISWEDWIQDVTVIAGALGIGVPLAARALNGHQPAPPPVVTPTPPITRRKDPLV